MGRPQRPHRRTSVKGLVFGAGRGLSTQVSKAKAWSRTDKGKAAIGMAGLVAASGIAKYIQGRYFIPNYWDGINRTRGNDYQGYKPTPVDTVHFRGMAENKPVGGTPFDMLFFKKPFHGANALVIGGGEVSLVPSASDLWYWKGQPESDPRIITMKMSGRKKLKPALGTANMHKIVVDEKQGITTLVLVTGQAVDLDSNGNISMRTYDPNTDKGNQGGM